MSEHATHDDGFVGHEESDAEIAPLVRFAIFLAVFTAIVAALTVGFYNYLDRREQAAKSPRYPMAVGVDRPLPPAPRLQTYPFGDVKALRREEAKLLEHYQWLDRNAGSVRIPIDRAMDLIAERGLPHRAATPAEPPAAAGSEAQESTAADQAPPETAPAAPPPHE